MEKKEKSKFEWKRKYKNKNDRGLAQQEKSQKKKGNQLSAVEFAEMNKIDWFPVDPYGD